MTNRITPYLNTQNRLQVETPPAPFAAAPTHLSPVQQALYRQAYEAAVSLVFERRVRRLQPTAN